MLYSFVFVCQSGRLEIEAAMLAASLRHYLRVDSEIVAAVPHPPERWGRLDSKTVELFEQLNVRIEPIYNQISDDYPVGNKLSCLTIPTDAERLIFLDSDILCIQELHKIDTLLAPISARPASANTFELTKLAWEDVYALFELDIPQQMITTDSSGETIPPYFNAGFIAVDPDYEFGKIWIDTCRYIIANMDSTNGYWMDQVSLPVAAHRLGLAITPISNLYNYSAFARLLVESEDRPILVHYHKPHIIRREPTLLQLIALLIEKHPLLKEIMRQNSDYQQLLPEQNSWLRLSWLNTKMMLRKLFPSLYQQLIQVRRKNMKGHMAS